MRITVKFFALAREKAGVSEAALDVPGDVPSDGTVTTVASAAKAIAERYPALASMLPKVAFAINQSYASADAPLRQDDELAVIPPVSGGAPATAVDSSADNVPTEKTRRGRD